MELNELGISDTGKNLLASIGLDAVALDGLRSVDESLRGCVPARITAVHRDRCVGLAFDGAHSIVDMHLRLAAALSEEGAAATNRPAVGDWALARPVAGLDGREGPAGMIAAVLPRRGLFARKEAGQRQQAQIIAANVDHSLVVAAAGHDFNLRRIERYLALAWEGETKPIIVLTKIDLAEEPEALVAEAEALAFGSPVVATSVLEGRGLEELGALLLPGSTSVLLGSSGAGKSSLLNALSGREVAATGEVRADDERGRHTTTRRELFRLPPESPAPGALVIDTPGLRELQLWADEEAVDDAFPDIEELAEACRFRDCRHEEEPGCAVRAALAAGSLDQGRHASWQKLRREVAWLDRRDDASLMRAELKRWKNINQSMRGYTKERRSIQGSAR